MKLIASACKSFGLTISLEKTKLMYTPAPGKTYLEPNILVEGVRLGIVDKFVYLGSTISRTGSVDDEINLRIGKAYTAFEKLQNRVWSKHDIKLATKFMFTMLVFSLLFFTGAKCGKYTYSLNTLERFHQNCLRKILNIKCPG